MKSKLGVIILLFGFILIGIKNIKERLNIEYQNKIISNIYDNHYKTNEYNGYIEIPKYNIKRLIKDDVSNDTLDKYYVGIMSTDNNNLLILAGHNINLVFHKIHYLKKDDLIYIYMNKKDIYKVIETKEISVDNYTYINKKYNKKTLILITCTKDKNKRFIVICDNING